MLSMNSPTFLWAEMLAALDSIKPDEVPREGVRVELPESQDRMLPLLLQMRFTSCDLRRLQREFKNILGGALGPPGPSFDLSMRLEPWLTLAQIKLMLLKFGSILRFGRSNPSFHPL